GAVEMDPPAHAGRVSTPGLEMIVAHQRRLHDARPTEAAPAEQKRRAALARTRAVLATEATETHSTVSCAPAPVGPKSTVAIPAASKIAASIQYCTPTSGGGAPSTSAAAPRTARAMAASVGQRMGARAMPLATVASGSASRTARAISSKASSADSPGSV